MPKTTLDSWYQANWQCPKCYQRFTLLEETHECFPVVPEECMEMSSRDDAQDYFFASLDFHLRAGCTPIDALANATSDYKFVFIDDDGRLPVARAAQVSLNYLRGVKNENDD